MPSSKSKPVPAFYNSGKSAHVLPVLSSQVKMVYQPTSHVRISACEEMTLTQLDVLLQESAEARVKTARARTPAAATPREKHLHTCRQEAQKQLLSTCHAPIPSIQRAHLHLQSQVCCLLHLSRRQVKKSLSRLERRAGLGGEVITWRSNWAGVKKASKC